MTGQSSGLYLLERLLSGSTQIETWLATNRLSGRECVVKRAASETDWSSINEILAESFQCQTRVRSEVLVTACRKSIENQRVVIEYRRLDEALWHTLSPEKFWSGFPQSLIQVCSIVDYLHSCEIVHGDLKLENFLVLDQPGVTRFALVDLDFACCHNSKPKARLFGTPDHIAPEVVANECVVTQSDTYSLGVSLRRYLSMPSEDILQDKTSWESTQQRLQLFTDALCRDDYLARPANLLQALYDSELLSRDELDSAHRELLSRILLSHWRLAGFRGCVSTADLKKLVVSRGKILGVHNELLDLMASALSNNRREAFRKIADTLGGCHANRHADYWHVRTDDASLLDFYSRLDALSTQNAVNSVAPAPAKATSGADQLAAVERLTASARYEQAYLLCRDTLTQIDAGKAAVKRPEYLPLLRHASRLSRRLNRLNENRDYLSRLVAATEHNGPDHGQLLEELVTANYLLARHDEALQLIDQRLVEAGQDRWSEYDLNLYRMKGWYFASSGNYDEGEKILREVITLASSLGYRRVLMLGYYSLGIMDWRRGLSSRAVVHMTESLKVARDAKMLDKAVAVLSMLTTVYSNLTDYTAAVKSGKTAARILSQDPFSELLPSVCVGISYAYTRLADFPKARYWVERYLDCGKYVREGDFAMVYYMIDGYLLLNQCNLQAARISLQKCLNLTRSGVAFKFLGQIHQHLADIALQQGEAAVCQRHADASQKAYQNGGDTPSTLETQMLSLLSQLLYRGSYDIEQTRSLLDHEFSDNCRYWCARLICHLLIASDRQNRPVLVSLARRLKVDFLSSPVPAFRVLSCLVAGGESESSDPLGWIKGLKAAAQESSRGQARFMLMTLLKAIGDACLERDQYRHAEKYFAQALTVAEALGNKPMAATIKDAVNSASARAADLMPFIDSFHAVSKILKEVNQSEESYHRLLQFALDQTGAERAVLLLQAGGSNKLYVAASLNCDNESVKDVTAISKSVTDRVTSGLEPIIVDDALTDKRTRSFRSIIAHNILSVACLPLVREERFQGVLYLDHNTLPSLFSIRDLKFIGAVSNFISSVVATVQSYQGLSQSNVRLRQDLSRLGQTGAFITSHPTMLRLFEGLPAIAQSDVPVLIRGESGTGKEIICEMLHRESLRSGHPLVKLNCAAIASSMVEAELFGVAKNAATGVAERDGKLSAANGGSLLLDEICDMPQEVQAKLLRAIEYQEFEKVGSNRTIHTNIRFICATNKDIEDMVRRDKFREDLYYRINRVVIELPPLRDRRGDVELLTEHFVQLLSLGRQRPRFDADVRNALDSYDWPGNVRELRNFVERCCILYPGKLISINTPEAAILRSSCASTLENCSPEQEKLLIERTLEKTNGNQTRAAHLLGISLSALRRRMKKYGLDK